MQFETDPTNASAAWDCTRILKALWQPARDGECIDICRGFAGTDVQAQVYEARGLMPPMVLFRSANASIIGFGGIQAVNNPAALCESYINDSISSATLSCNPRIHAAAMECYNQRIDAAYLQSRYVWIIGHSYGGAIAQALAAIWGGVEREHPWRLCTFGSPRMSNMFFYDRVKGLSRGRWVTRNDPVPHAPFQPSEAPTLYGFLTQRQRDRLAMYVAYMQCFQIHAGGQIYAAPSSELGPARTESTFYNWAIGANGFTSPMHSINAYEMSLRLANIIPSPNPPILPTVPDTPETPERRGPATNAAINMALNGVADDSGINRGVPVVIPKNSRVTYRRAGTMYQIFWHGKVIGIAPNLTQARSVCRSQNRANRTLLTLVRSEGPAHVDALSDFLGAAAAGTDGFAPRLANGGNPPVPVIG